MRHATVASMVTLYIFAGIASVYSATLYDINPWIIPPAVIRYPTLNTTCGDTIQFVWSQADGSTGVFKLPPGSNGVCPTRWDNSSGQELAPVSLGGNMTYIVGNEPSFWITSPAGNGSYCNRGQLIRVNVTCPATSTGRGAAETSSTAPGNVASARDNKTSVAEANVSQPADAAAGPEPLPPVAAPASVPAGDVSAVAMRDIPIPGTQATPGAYGATAETPGTYGAAAIGGY